jgi:arylsulfatase A-like enzyme
MSNRGTLLPLGLLLVTALATAAGCGRHGKPQPSQEVAATSSPDVAPPPPSAAPSAPGAALPQEGKNLNVLLITVDSLRADMPWAGYGRPIAPAMTAFADTAVVYDRFYSISSYTAMSLGGMLSGRYPSELDRSGYYFAGYPDSVLFFPELLQQAGVRTMSAQSHFYFDQRAGFRQAFDVYEIVPGLDEDHQTDNNVTSPEQLKLALGMLSDKANTDGRFFAWFHFLDPHDKYQAHPGIAYGHTTRDLYDGEVTFTDQHIGKLLDYVASQPWGARTAVVISADHGEGFGEHACFRHGFELWDVLTHVPFMIRVPGVAPRHVATPRSAIDLAPTILDLFGVKKDPAMEGTSLMEELHGKDPPARDIVLDLPRTTDSDRKRALIRGDMKLVAIGDDEAFQMYDLGKDPKEDRDLQWSARTKFEEMKGAYREWSGKIPSICPATLRQKLRGRKKYKPC